MSDLSILSWNIQGSPNFPRTFFWRVAPRIRQTPASVICLQEGLSILSHQERVVPFDSHQPVIGSGNIIFSRYELVNAGTLDFPISLFPQLNLEQVAWSDLRLDTRILRLYNCHLGIRGIGPSQRAQQLGRVLAHARHHEGPAIICGDMNTTIPAAGLRRRIVQIFHSEPDGTMHVDGEPFTSDERYPFARLAEQHGFREAIDMQASTWAISPQLNWEIFDLKLDWFFVRGMDLPKITLGDYISDHRSVLAEW